MAFIAHVVFSPPSSDQFVFKFEQSCASALLCFLSRSEKRAAAPHAQLACLTSLLLSRPPWQAQCYEHHALTHWGLGRVLHTVFEHSFSRSASTCEQLAADSTEHPLFSFRSPHLSTNSNHSQKCTPISRRIVFFNNVGNTPARSAWRSVACMRCHTPAAHIYM